MTNADDYTELEMATKTIGKVEFSTDEKGKIIIKRVHKFPAGQRRAAFAKAARAEKKWKGK